MVIDWMDWLEYCILLFVNDKLLYNCENYMSDSVRIIITLVVLGGALGLSRFLYYEHQPQEYSDVLVSDVDDGVDSSVSSEIDSGEPQTLVQKYGRWVNTTIFFVAGCMMCLVWFVKKPLGDDKTKVDEHSASG